MVINKPGCFLNEQALRGLFKTLAGIDCSINNIDKYTYSFIIVAY
jgi:hypothetical protein